MSTFEFASFWEGGKLSPYELLCVTSFIKKGCDFTLYSYDKIEHLPPQIKHVNAREILPPDYLNKFLVHGAPSIAHFSDYFRYVMFQKTNHTWVDTDVILLRNFDFTSSEYVLGMETATSINNAVLKISNNAPHLSDLIRKVEALIGKELSWGDTGPRMLSQIFGECIRQLALPPTAFYPIHYDDYHKVFLPEFRSECEDRCKSSYALHLWNNRIVKLGIWKNFGPPKDSFLYNIILENDAERFFTDFYPEDVMRIMVRNAVFNNSGFVSTVKKIISYTMPGVYNALRRSVLR